MPLYEYRCTACGHVFEKIQSFTAPDWKECPKCGGPVERLISAPAIQFKGSGFYLTDYGKGGSSASKGGASGEGSSGSESKAGGGSSSGEGGGAAKSTSAASGSSGSGGASSSGESGSSSGCSSGSPAGSNGSSSVSKTS